ncbi:MAG: lipid-A-disaccharide synthase [Deltaproteobacteria bacterium]|nr:lipid-A-disaccharide synthase [Deltaproteobacteria bacterium]
MVLSSLMRPPNDKSHCIFMIAGEASGDLHGANLVKALKRKKQNIVFSGIGGKAMQDAGVEIVVDAATLSVVGITEVLSKLPGILGGMAAAKSFLKNARPDLLILIDFPDFNLRIASVAKKLHIPVLFYISPQIWAWRSGRVTKIGRLVDHIAVILPFEATFYRKHHIPVTFVGHPLLDEFKDRPIPFPGPLLEKSHPPVIGLLPGSRESEIFRLLPVMLQAARILSRQMDIRFVVSMAPGAPHDAIKALCLPFQDELRLEIDPDGARSVFAKTHLVVAASGTVTLEAAIAGTPVVIIYKVSPISYRLGKALIKVKHIGLVNLIADREIVPELIQDRASPELIAETVLKLVNTPSALDAIRRAFVDVRNRLGGPGASSRVADIALNMLEGHTP